MNHLLTITLLLASPLWTIQTSGTTARLRGVSVVSDRVAWASGSESTVLRTTDGGTTWQKLTVTTKVGLEFNRRGRKVSRKGRKERPLCVSLRNSFATFAVYLVVQTYST